MPYEHVSVLLGDPDRDVLGLLKPVPGEVVLDATLGLGGHSEAFLQAVAPEGALYGIDADSENLERAEKRLKPLPGTKKFVHGNFRDVAGLGLPTFDIIFADLGLSSPHIDDPKRGFTYRAEAPLDLRFDQTKGETAAEFLESAKEEDIAQVLREYGEVKDAGRLGARLSEKAKQSGIRTTTDVRSVIDEALGYKAPKVLPQIFQALRMHVNGELDALKQFLSVAPWILNPGGRLGIISYHSLEDRMVKQTFRALTTPTKDPEHGTIAMEADFELLTKKPVRPSATEVKRNPRARSALFRVIRRRSSFLLHSPSRA